MNAYSEGFILGFLFCGVLSGALLLVSVREALRESAEDREGPD